ncbi:nucleotide sugar dehydrogenase [Nocardioides salsibiostraticola]
MRIAVIGMGKIGLPLAAQFAEKGNDVVGIDVNTRTVDSINAGEVPFPGEAHLDEYIARLVPSGRLRATTNYADGIPTADVVVVVVPLFVDTDGEPDFGWMDASTRDLAETLTPRTLVSYETTLPVGTTRNRWKPMIEEISGLAEGTDFDLVFSPERVLTGRVFRDLRAYPKLIGALSPAGAERARAFYEAVLDFDERPDLPRPNGVWDLGTAEASELAKLAETTYRDVNIGLANQFALFAENAGIDVHHVIDACNSQPFSHIHQPGISVGGHCIPVYPRLYLHNDPNASIVSAARQANSAMPAQVVQRIAREFGDLNGLKATVLGAAYRGGVKETAFSGVFETVTHLEAAGAMVTVHDPMYSDDALLELGLAPHHLGEETDIAILHTDHREYDSLSASDFPGLRLFVYGRRHTTKSFGDVDVLSLGISSAL